jgi:protein TonB
MNVDAWGIAEEDTERSKRLAIGYAAGVALIVCLVGVAATVRAASEPKEQDEVIDVKLATTAPAPPPPPPPPPEPAKARPAPAARKAIIAPTAVPTEAPPESDKPVKPATGPDDYADGKGGKRGGVAGGDPNGVVGGVLGGTGSAVPAPPPPPPPTPPPPPPGPVAVTEDMTPASAVSTPDPPVPDEARSQGISATVVVRFTITETGAVTDVTVVRGSHSLLDPVIIATVKGWRYKPALTSDGRPVASKKTKTFRFNFKQ